MILHESFIEFRRIFMGLWLVLSVLLFFLKIDVLSTYFKLAFVKALLKLCNLEYAIRS